MGQQRGSGVAYWLRRCATSRKVPGYKMSARTFLGVEAAGA